MTLRYRVKFDEWMEHGRTFRDGLVEQGLADYYDTGAESQGRNLNGDVYRDDAGQRFAIIFINRDETLENGITNAVLATFPQAEVWRAYDNQPENYGVWVYGQAIAVDGTVTFDRPVPFPHCEWCETEQLPYGHEDHEDIGLDRHLVRRGYRTVRVNICASCLDDATFCDDCGVVGQSEDYWGSVNDNIVCEYCLSSYQWCDDCEEYYHGECETHRVHESYCDCYECEGNRVIRNYSYRPSLYFYDTNAEGKPDVKRTADKGKLYMGFELETEVEDRYEHDRDALARLVQDGLGELVYLKEDGSLSHGFEIVTHPMTLAYAQNHVKWGTLEAAAKDGLRAWKKSSCGLHIHLSRSAFTGEAHLYKFMLMVYRNGDMLQQFAGRYNSSYARFSEDERKAAKKRAKGEENYERYVAVNCQNDATLELRFYRPSLAPTTVIAALEMTHALWAYSGQLSAGAVYRDEGFTFGAFRKWIANQSEYRHLSKRIQERCDRVEDM